MACSTVRARLTNLEPADILLYRCERFEAPSSTNHEVQYSLSGEKLLKMYCTYALYGKVWRYFGVINPYFDNDLSVSFIDNGRHFYSVNSFSTIYHWRDEFKLLFPVRHHRRKITLRGDGDGAFHIQNTDSPHNPYTQVPLKTSKSYHKIISLINIYGIKLKFPSKTF